MAFLLAFSASAYAQGNTITVVGDDGTKTSIEIAPSPLAPPVAPKIDLRKNSVAPPQAAPADPAPTPAPKAAAKPVKKPAPQKQAAPKETPAKKAPVKKEVAPKKKKTAKAPEKKSPQKAQPSKATSPAQASPQPVQPNPNEGGPVSRSFSEGGRLGPHMTPDDAIRIALDVAPPARSVHAFAVNYKGLHCYQVIFATEDGDRSVFVDRETGKVVQ